MKLFLALVAVFAVVQRIVAERIAISVKYDTVSKRYNVQKATEDPNADAYGVYTRDYNGGGWNTLELFQSTNVTTTAQHMQNAKTFGFTEGYLTCSDIKGFYNNFYSAVFGTGRVGTSTVSFLKDNYNWLKDMSAQNGATDDYWYTVGTVMQQLDGLYEGYVAGCGSSSSKADITNKYATLDSPTLEHFLLINAWGDLYQISSAFAEPAMNSRLFGKHRKSKLAASKEDASKLESEQFKLINRCSAIIKLLPDLSDVVYGHNTWDTFESMAPRILKHYSFPLFSNGANANQPYEVHFSSSPAVLSSVDDFFTLTGYSQLGVIETTNNLYNVTLLDLLTPKSVLSWQRAITSNQMAKSGADWAQQFSRYHSGTYTNQWMSLDLKLFNPGNKPETGFLTVFEEVPGLVHVEDQTATLNKEMYWASYNVPVYADISAASGYANLCARDVSYCHDTDPRALLFKQYQSNVTSIEGGKWILTYNNWQNDAASDGDSCNAIACRGDLEANPAWVGAYGALDAKVTSAVTSKVLPGQKPVVNARLGPTHDQQPVFCWSTMKDESDYSHVLAPDCFNYDWIVFPSQA